MKGAMKNCKIWPYESVSQTATNSCNLEQARKVLPNASLVPGRQQCFRSFPWFWLGHCFVTGCRWSLPRSGPQFINNSKCTKPLPFSRLYSIFGAHSLHSTLIRTPAVIQKTESLYINLSVHPLVLWQRKNSERFNKQSHNTYSTLHFWCRCCTSK
jgi:hypothetical protein